MKFLKVCIIIAWIFVLASAYASQDTTKLFNKANNYYRDNEIDKAIEVYENIVSSGEISGTLFYNLGNAYLKKAKIGKAILNYERAKISIPRDRELVFNLEYARTKIKQQDIAYQTNTLNSFLIMSVKNISLNENIILFFLFFSLFLILIILGLYAKNIRLLLHFLAVLCIVVAVLLIIPAQYKCYNNDHSAIIVEELTDAKYEPLEGADSHFPLYEGNKVFVLRETTDWLKVKRPDGKIGWIKDNTAVMLKT